MIPILDKVISHFGCPKIIKTDNGASFNSLAFANYSKHIGFMHRKIAPLWPRANAQAESFSKTFMKSIRTARLEGKNWRQEMHKFLRQYRSTPHPSTKFSPFQLLFGRSPKRPWLESQLFIKPLKFICGLKLFSFEMGFAVNTDSL